MSKLIEFKKDIFGLGLSLAKSNFKLRNEGSYLGIFWYLLNPLILFLIILFIKNQAFSHSEIPNYPIYLLIGLLLHNFFVHTVGASVGIISMNSGFIKSIKIPIESLVISRVFQSIFSHIFEFVLIAASLVYLGIGFEGLFIYLVVFVFFAVFVLGVSFMFATLGVFFRDLNNVWIVIGQFLFFITPIFYYPSIDSLLYKVNLFNPIYYFVTAGRSVFVWDVYPSISQLICIFVGSISTLIIGLIIFNSKKIKFAELV